MEDKINVFYREFQVGNLYYRDCKFVYEVIQENVDKANEKGYLLFLFDCDKNFDLPVLPNTFKDLVLDDKQSKLFPDAKILPIDNDFVRLYKLAKLKDLVQGDFHISVD